MNKLSSVIMAFVLAFALAGTGRAQETAVAAPAAQDADVEVEEEGGFDDWGLLGLLGLAGLAGLRRQEPEVRTVDRTGGVR